MWTTIFFFPKGHVVQKACVTNSPNPHISQSTNLSGPENPELFPSSSQLLPATDRDLLPLEVKANGCPIGRHIASHGQTDFLLASGIW